MNALLPQKKNYCRRLLGCLIGTLIFGLASCTDEVGGGALSGSGSITFTVGGIAEGDAKSLTRAQLEPQTVRQDLGDGLSLVYTLSLNPTSLTRSSTAMEAGKKFRVIVYKADDESFVAEKEFTVGGADFTIGGLPKDTYKLVAISYNSDTAPDAVDADNDNYIDSPTITVDPSKDLLYWMSSTDIDLTSGTGSAGVITFDHCFTKVTVEVSSSLTGNDLVSVPESATLTPGYLGMLTLLYGSLNNGSLTQLPTFQLGNSSIIKGDAAVSDTHHVFTGNNNNQITLNFKGNLVVDAPLENKTISNPEVTFSDPNGSTILLPGHAYTLQMRVEASKGDYYPYASATGTGYEATIPLGSAYSSYNGGSLTFLRYNLGADPSMTVREQMAYPHTDDKNIRVYGGLYQWGRQDKEHSLRDIESTANAGYFTNTQYAYGSYDPDNDHQFVYGFQPSWLSNDIDNSAMWGDGLSLGGLSADTPPSYTGDQNKYDPCPTGYRVPTEYEWALISNDHGTVGTPQPRAYDDDLFTMDDDQNVYASGSTWAVPYSNQNIVWVRVSDGKASDVTWEMGHLNGHAIYAKSAVGDGSGSSDVYNAAFGIGADLTDPNNSPEPLLFLPAAGERSYAKILYDKPTQVGTEGHYWSCTCQPGERAYTLTLRDGNMVGMYDYLTTYYYRSYGRSVRCVKK